jgi:hypothetical protein
MVRLEELVPGSRVQGIAGRDFVEVLAVRFYGPDAVEVIYKAEGALPESTILYRSSEADLELASATRRFAFDGDGHLFRLASEALRIRLAHLFDPFVAVRSSQIDALPHQLTAVYGEMIPRQPWAREAGLHPTQLYRWRRRLCARQGATSGFTPVQIIGESRAPELLPAPVGVIEIELADGTRLRIDDHRAQRHT